MLERLAPLALASTLLAPAAFADSKPYTITVAKVAAKVGQPATAKVVIKPAAGYHMNQDYPTSLKLTPVAGVTLPKADFAKADAALAPEEASFQVALTSTEAGTKSVAGNVRFAVCAADNCSPQKDTVTITVDARK